jgi:hypothetical protein
MRHAALAAAAQYSRASELSALADIVDELKKLP